MASANTALVNVQCPQTSRPGDSFEITVEGAQYTVKVPPGVGPGQIFRVNIPAPPQPPPVRAMTAAPTIPPAAASSTSAAVRAYPASATGHDGRPTADVPEATVVSASAQQQPSPNFFAEPPPSAKPAPPAPLPTGSTATATSNLAEANPFGDEPTSEANPFADDDDDVSDPHAWAIAPFKAEFDAAFQAAGPAARPGGLPPALSPAQVKALLMPTGLPKESLRAVWELSDLDKDGVLDADEFAVAMYLCRQAQNGEAVPKVLPDNAVPPSKRNPF